MRRGGSPTSMTLSDSVYERLLQQRIIVLGQQVDDDIANRIAAQMLLLAAEDPVADIALYINSPGGSVTAGMAIFDTMEFIPCDVATYAMGLAASMGQDISIQAELFRRHKQEMAQLIAGHTGQPVEKIIADFDRDRWFSAAEALEYGFVDHVISRAGQLPDAISENGIAENVAPVNAKSSQRPRAVRQVRRPAMATRMTAASATRISAAHTGPTSGAATRMNSHTAPQTAPR